MGEKIHIRGRTYDVIDRMTLGTSVYDILERLSAGPRERYLAYDQDASPNGDLCAIHVLPKSKHAEQQLDVLRRISRRNSNLPILLKHDAQADKITLVFAWVWGTNLQEFLDQARKNPKRRASPAEAFRLFRGLAHGLGQLNQYKNIVHGDIKPANLILCRDPTQLVMIDFGSAWLVENTVRREPGDGYSDIYAAPEQMLQKPFVDFRSDQFSASVVGYQLLTDEIPYEIGGKAGLDEYRERYETRLLPPSKKCPAADRIPRKIWRKIDAVLLKGLALSPANRFPSRKAWLRELNQIKAELDLQPELTGRNELLTRFVSWWRKK